MSTPPLFTGSELADFLHKDVGDREAVTAERVVWGWIKPLLKLDDRPDPVPDELFSWAIELGAIAFENPTGRAGQANGPFSVQYGTRRDEILQAIKQSTLTTGGQLPKGNFPPPICYPDPIRVRGRRRW